MAAQKLARRKGEDKVQSRARLAELLNDDEIKETSRRRRTASRALKIKPIEERGPYAWRNVSHIEPLFERTLMETPAQIGFAQMAEAIQKSQKLAVETQSASPIEPSPFGPLPAAGAAGEVLSTQDLIREQHFDMVRNPLKVHSSAAVAIETKARQTRAQILFERLRMWVRRMLALIARMQGPQLTASGMHTLRQLQRLYALIGAGWTTDDMEMVRLRVAYGEAYYQVMEASRRKRTHRRRDEPGEYQSYIERFLAAEQY